MIFYVPLRHWLRLKLKGLLIDVIKKKQRKHLEYITDLLGDKTALIPVFTIFDVNLFFLDKSQILEIIQRSLCSSQKAVINNANIHALNLSFNNIEFKQVLNKSQLVFCDGYGLVLAARLAGVKGALTRSTPPDFIEDICHWCEENSRSLFFLGGIPGVALKATELLQLKYPKLKIYSHHGYFDKQKNSEGNRVVINEINKIKPDLLLVGFGMPEQELWIEENKQILDVKIFMSVGGAFDYISGYKLRAPQFLSNNCLEWLWRLVLEPRRLWRRYILGIPLFFYRFFRDFI